MNKSKAKMGKPTTPQSVGNNSPQSRNTTPSRNRAEKDIPYEGIYQNLRFCETITSLMGNTVQIQLSNGKLFEGIFSTFSPQLEVVLELVHSVDPSQPEKIDIASVTREVVFSPQLIVMMSSKDVELDFATKDFATDSSISRFNGLSGEKELEPWVGDGDDCNISLDNANGWDPNEMFARNEKVYGIQTNFEQDLSQYTCKLEKRDSVEFKEREAQAQMLAESIEGNMSSKAQTDLENASDEEEKYSAVVRPSHSTESRERREPRDFRDFSNRSSSDRGPMGGMGRGGSAANSSGGGAHDWKYVHPNKGRPPSKPGMQTMGGKMMRPNQPPHGGHAHSNLAPRHQTVGGGNSGSGAYHGSNNYDGDSRASHPNSGPGGHHGGGYHQGGPQHQPFQGSQGRGSSTGGQYYRSQGPPGGYNSNRNNSAQQSDSRLANGEERKLNREPSYDAKNNHGPSHSNAPMGPMAQRDHGPKDQRKGYAAKTRDDQNTDLKKFGQDFRLALTSPSETVSVEEKRKATPSPPTTTPAPTPAQTSAPAPTMAPAPSPLANNKTNSPPPTTTAPVQAPTAAATAPAVAPTPAPASVPISAPAPTPTPPIVTVAQPLPPPTTQPTSGRSPVVSPVLVHTPQPTPANGGSGSSSVREATPVDDKANSDVLDKTSDSLKKSSLNPNAKEFVLNPNARVFIPTPPRSQTPQAQQGGQMLMQTQMGSMGPVGPGMPGSASPGQGMPLLPVVHYVPAPSGVQNQGPGGGGGGPNQPHFPPHNPGGQRFRKPTPMPVNHRPDLASSMHVAAATGQPLMAPAPMGGPQLFYPPQGAMLPGQPQPYPQLYTMRLVGPQMQGMVPNSAYADSTTTGHGPIYMSPGHGQGVNNQGQMGPPQPQQPQQQQQHHHPNTTPSPAQQHSMAQQTPSGNPPQLIYQTAGGHHGHNPGPPHPHHVSFPVVFPYPGHTQMPPGVSGPSAGPGGPQGVQILPLGSTAATAAGMAAMGMAIPHQIHYIQQGPGTGGQPSHMQPFDPS